MQRCEERTERDRPLDGLKNLIPQPLKAEAKVQMELPPEARALMRDLHQDREYIGWGFGLLLLLGFLFLGVYALRTTRYIFWGN